MSVIIHQLMRFGFVGGAATLIHFMVALGISALYAHILWANAVGFIVAFLVSFFGHRHYTFAVGNVPAGDSFWRFTTVAVGGFFFSDGLLAALLKATSLPEPAALALALATTAGLNFLVSRYWVFHAGARRVGHRLFRS